MKYLKLATPVTIGTKTYQATVPARVTIDLRTRNIDLMLALAEEVDDQLRVASEWQEGPADEPGGERIILPTPPVGSITISDDFDRDPAIGQLFVALGPFFTAVAEFLFANDGIRTLGLGEDTVDLNYDLTEPPEEKHIGVQKKEKRSKSRETESADKKQKKK
jgi:hypothetical protein